MLPSTPKPGEAIPTVPFDVEIFIEETLGRCELALKGDMPESKDLANTLAAEYAAMDARGVEPGGPEDYEVFLAYAAGLILKDMEKQLDIVEGSPTDTPLWQRQQQAEQSRVFAELLNTGLNLVRHTNGLVEPPHWPSEAHAICHGIAFGISHNLGGEAIVRRLIDDWRVYADDIAPANGATE